MALLIKLAPTNWQSAHVEMFSIVSFHELFFWPDSLSHLLSDKTRDQEYRQNLDEYYKEISLHTCILCTIDTSTWFPSQDGIVCSLQKL